MNDDRYCYYGNSCLELVTHWCQCSGLFMCENHVGHHMNSQKADPYHSVFILRTVLSKDMKANYTANILELLANIKVFRTKILSESEKLVSEIKKMSMKTLTVLESRLNSYSRLLVMINNPVTDAEKEEIQTKARENVYYAEFTNFGKFESIITPFFNQNFSGTQAVFNIAENVPHHTKSPSSKEIPQRKPRSRSVSPDCIRKSYRNWDCSCGESNSVQAANCKTCRSINQNKNSYRIECSICMRQIYRPSCYQCRDIVHTSKLCSECKNSLNGINTCSDCDKIIAESSRANKSGS